MVARVRRSVSRKYGFRQSSYINFKVEEGYFFCLYFYNCEARLTVKPMYADDLWWEIWDIPENLKAPLSLRGTGAFALSGQILGVYEIAQPTDENELTECIESVFQQSTVALSEFLAANPHAETFFPDEAQMDHDPDRLLYLMALIHNGREQEALALIREARKQKHHCMFQSGMFSDSYTYISHWCQRRRGIWRIPKLAILFNHIIRIRAFALMAIESYSGKSDYPNVLTIRFLDGLFIFATWLLILFFCQDFTPVWISCIIYFIFLVFIDTRKTYEKYYTRFWKLPDKTRKRWKVGALIFVVVYYIIFFFAAVLWGSYEIR